MREHCLSCWTCPNYFPCIFYVLKWSHILTQEELCEKKLHSLFRIHGLHYPERTGPVSCFLGDVLHSHIQYDCWWSWPRIFYSPNLDIHTILKLDQEAEGPLGKLICKKFTVYLSSILIPRYISKRPMMRLMSIKCIGDNFPCWTCFSFSQGGSVTLLTREL